MRRAIVALSLLAIAAAAARADDAARAFTFEFGGGDDATGARIAIELPRWVDALPGELKPDAQWALHDAGPFEVVQRATHCALVVDGRSATVTVVLHDPGLPSANAAVDAIGARIVERLRGRVEALATEIRASRRAPLESTIAAADAETRVLDGELDAAGDAGVEHDIAMDRLRRVETEFAQARIDRAVAAAQLTAARAAAQRALEVRQLEERVKDAEDDVKDATPAEHDAAVKLLKEVRALLDQALAKAPPLDAARERVASLEADLVGLESRESLLGKERDDLRAQLRDLASRLRRQSDLTVRRRAAQTRADEARAGLARSDTLQPPSFRLLSPLAPVLPERK